MGLNLLDSFIIKLFLDELIDIYGKIKQLDKDLTKYDDPMYEILMHKAENKPQNRQFTLA